MASQLQTLLDHIQNALTGKGQIIHQSTTGIRRIDRWIDFAKQFSHKSIHDLQDSNPLNVFLTLVIIYLFFSLLKPHSIKKLTPTLAQARSTKQNANSSYSFLPDQHPPSTVWKKYTPRTLAIHDGSGAAAMAASMNGGANQSQQTKGKGVKSSSSLTNSNQILLAIDGKVFDVTKGANFYGPGGPYGNFAGRDASRGMAKQSFDLEMLTPLDQRLDKLQDLTPMERNNMVEWISHFTAKYTVVGELVNEGEEGDD